MISRAITALLLFLLPFAVFYLWRRAWPRWEAKGWMLGLAAAGLLLALGSFVWYGQERGMAPDATYVPARIGPDGRVLAPHVGPHAAPVPTKEER